MSRKGSQRSSSSNPLGIGKGHLPLDHVAHSPIQSALSTSRCGTSTASLGVCVNTNRQVGQPQSHCWNAKSLFPCSWGNSESSTGAKVHKENAGTFKLGPCYRITGLLFAQAARSLDWFTDLLDNLIHTFQHWATLPPS